MGLVFKIFWGLQNLVCFCGQIAKMSTPFFGKIPKICMGIYFLEKLPLNMGMCLELLAAHPDQSKSEHPLPWISTWMYLVNVMTCAEIG